MNYLLIDLEFVNLCVASFIWELLDKKSIYSIEFGKNENYFECIIEIRLVSYRIKLILYWKSEDDFRLHRKEDLSNFSNLGSARIINWIY
jgi:hypothetical protein